MESSEKPSRPRLPGITALIIDDEQGAINSLRQMLREYCPQVTGLFAAETVRDALRSAAAVKPDLVFLDIEMPPLGSGFDFLKNCGDMQFGVIFTTAYPEYAVRAINAVQPWAYLVKPFSVSELTSALELAHHKIQQYRDFADQAAVRCGIILRDSRKGNIVLRMSDILFCKAEGSFTAFTFLRNQKIEKILASGNLGEYEAQLPSTFFCRTHHSFLVNLLHTERIERTGRNGVAHLLQSGLKVDVSVAKMDQLLRQLELFWADRSGWLAK